jgi:outer membrane receptor protein involved in Fe transport
LVFGPVLLSVASAAAAAQPAAPSGVGGATTANAVIGYPASFFAAAQPTTALDLVKLIPGFVFYRGDAVRGYGGAAPNVLIDGARPASKDDSVEDILRRLPASQIVRIDVIRGGAPGIDMQGKTVIANLIRRTDEGGKLTVSASGVRDAQGKMEGVARVEGEWRENGWFFEGSGQVAGYFDDGGGFGAKVRYDATGKVIVQGQQSQVGVQDDDRITGAAERDVAGGKLRVSASFTSQPYGAISIDSLTLPSGGDLDDYHQNQQTLEFGSRYERSFGPRVSMETVLLEQLGWGTVHDDFTEAPQVAAVTGDDTADLFDLDKRKGETIASVRVRVTLSHNLSLNTGAEADYNWLTSDTTFIENGSPVVLPAADEHVTETRGETFALADWQPRPAVNLEAGLRVEASQLASSGDESSDQSFVYPKPRAVLTLSPTAVDQIRLRVEREVGQLNFDNFTASTGNIESGEVRAGNPQLTPQSDWVFEAAAERRFWDAGDVTVTARHYDLYDVIDRVPVVDPAGTFDAPGNIGGGSRDEIALALTLPLDRLLVKGGLITAQSTWRWSRVIDPTTGVARAISALPLNSWEAHFTQGLPQWRASWGVDAVGEYSTVNYRFDEIDIDKLRPYVALFGEYKPKDNLSLRAEIRNITDRDYLHTRLVYNGLRSDTPLDYTEVRDLRAGRYLFLRVVKTFL